LTDIYADICGLERCYAVAAGEPPSIIEKLIWHPEYKKVYLSFPITGFKDDTSAQEEIKSFRDRIREFLIVFDPHACRDYDETYERDEMTMYRKQVGDVTEERDYRFIDQADAIVVYYPKVIYSKGVDAEMNHARRTGKPIYMYTPDNNFFPGPFGVPPSHVRNDQDEFVSLLMKELSPSE
jgi:hypothetical protein